MKLAVPHYVILLLLALTIGTPDLQAQLGFCTGNSGDPIFTEDFGSGIVDGPELPPGTTFYNFTTGTPFDGDYTISSTTNYFNWHTIEDHTPGDSNGKAFIVNASFTAGEFYQRAVYGLCENTTYEFSSWLVNLLPRNSCENNGIPINVRFQIWDETDTNLLAQGDTGNIPNRETAQWEQYALVFKTLPGQTSVILKMRNNSNGGCGNDLAIDDIVFKSCGDSVTVSTDRSEDFIIACEDQGAVGATLVTLTDSSIFATHAYQWQESTDGQVWTDITGANTDTYTTGSLTATHFYRVKVAEDAINLSNDLCNVLSDVFEINIVPIPLSPMSHGDQTICDGETATLSVQVMGDYQVNWYDAAQNGTLLQENSTTFSPTVSGTYYAEASSRLVDCRSGRTAVSLTINPLPQAEDEHLLFCEGTPITLSANTNNAAYLWNTGETTPEIVVTIANTYTVTITDGNGCSAVKTIVLEGLLPPVINTILSDGPNIVITLENMDNYEFALDNGPFQTSPVFENVTGGHYVVHVRDTAQCTTLSLEYLHLVVPDFFTPNGDNVNDIFTIEGISSFTDTQLQVFDRYGKLLLSGQQEHAQWDGKYNGASMPSGNYWYHIKADTIIRRGPFLLKR